MPLQGRNAYCIKVARIALVVEDDPSQQAVLSALLWGAGFRAWPVPHGLAMAERLRAAPPSVVVITAEFARQRGGDWLAELSRRPRWQNVPVIVATTKVDSVFAESLRRAGVPVVRRPVERDDLHRALAALGLPWGDLPLSSSPR
jgi:CheY-like chemotaxis protein